MRIGNGNVVCDGVAKVEADIRKYGSNGTGKEDIANWIPTFTKFMQGECYQYSTKHEQEYR